MRSLVLLSGVVLVASACSAGGEGETGATGGAGGDGSGPGGTGGNASGGGGAGTGGTTTGTGGGTTTGSGGAAGAGGGGTAGAGGGGTAGAGGSGGSGGTYVPCAGKACGDTCTVCDPADPSCVETGVVKACDKAGNCVPSPADCGEKTCTYDGKTYAPGDTFPALDGCNTCTCMKTGEIACTEKACPPPPCDGGSCGTLCGGIGGIGCMKGEYCHYPDGTCLQPDAAGTCEVIPPPICPAVFDPVCGCDGKTYGNPCEAASQGMSIAHDGPC